MRTSKDFRRSECAEIRPLDSMLKYAGSYAKLADETGLSIRSLFHWQSGKHQPSNACFEILKTTCKRWGIKPPHFESE